MSDMNEYIQIKKIGLVITGKTPSTTQEDNFDGEYPFITPTDIKTFDEKYIIETERTISQKGYNILKNNLLPSNAICFVCIGSTIGKMCLTNKPSFTNQQINAIIVNDNFDAHYIFYLLRYIKSYFQQIGAGTGSGKGIVNKSTFEKSRVCVEKDIHTQKKIASILSAYDELIENNNRRIKILEQMAENLYKEWFVRFRFPGYQNAEFENGIPKGWEYKMLSDITEVLQRGISPNYDDDGKYTVISQKCIRGNTMDITEARQQTKEYKDFLGLKDADTVICSTGTGTLGRVGKVIGEYSKTTFDSHVSLARAKKGLSKQFLYSAIKDLQPWFMNMGIGSTNQQELYISLIRKTKILLPTEDLLKQYESCARPIHDEVGLLMLKNTNLIKQRDLLLPRLMSRKLEVKL